MISSGQKLKARYQVKDRLQVKVIEQVDARAWIVSLNGVLIQVYNSTNQKIKEGDTVWVTVVSVDPPQLAWGNS